MSNPLSESAGDDHGRSPWSRGSVQAIHLLVGGPGAGVTSLLLKSSLRFTGEPDPAAGGVRWWSTGRAAYVELSARFTVGPDHASGDTRREFLRQLRAHRPGRPLDGIVVVVPCERLVANEADEMARSLRGTIGEITHALGRAAPIGLIATKVDLIAGLEDAISRLGGSDVRAAVGAEALTVDGVVVPAGPPFTGPLRRRLGPVAPRLAAELDEVDRRVGRFVDALLERNVFQPHGPGRLCAVAFASSLGWFTDGLFELIEREARRCR